MWVVGRVGGKGRKTGLAAGDGADERIEDVEGVEDLALLDSAPALAYDVV